MELENVQVSAKDHNDIGLRILKELHMNLAERKNPNLIFSPLSIYLIIGIIATGMSQGSKLNQLLSVLKVDSIANLNLLISEISAVVFGEESPPGPPNLFILPYDVFDPITPPPSVTTSTAIWIHQSLPINPNFQNILENVYNGRLNQVDFVNKYKEVANDVIDENKLQMRKQEITEGIKKSTRLIVCNSIDFKASWAYSFDNIATKECEFYLLNKKSVTVPFMTKFFGENCSVFPGLKVMTLIYKTGLLKRNFSMNIYLPDAIDGLSSLIERVCSEPGFLENHCLKNYREVDRFKIPKFTFSDSFMAKETLEKIGLNSLFSLTTGDFSEMVMESGDEDEEFEVTVSNILHQCRISVGEKSTEIGCRRHNEMFGYPLINDPVKIDFIADHPFLFVIRENNTNTILFIGLVLDPSLSLDDDKP